MSSAINIKDVKVNRPSLHDPNEEKSKTVNNNKGHDLEQIRQNLAKRSLTVKFDLERSNYKAIENIGAGAYGVVCSAVDKKSGDKVAIKKTTHVFEVLLVAKRTYREIKILKHFKHDNIINIREILLPKEDVKSFKDIYIVFDLMESDLHHIIYSRQSLSDEHVRYFLYQILRGLKYIHSANVVHRDLKPSNLLVNEDCHLRIGDFGMARGIFYTPDEPSYYMTQYVATRWYRAPEILLSMLEYGTAVDMWSVGCIFAEMMGRKHLFPGKDYMSQVKLILGVLGTPPDSLMKSSQNDILKRIIKSFGKKAAEPWEKLFPNANKKSLDLLSKMLVLNPAERITVEQALSHRLLNPYHDPDDEPICVPAFNFDFEKKEMDMAYLRSSMMKEIMAFHRPKPPSLSFSAFLRPAPKEEIKTETKPGEESVKLLSDILHPEPKAPSEQNTMSQPSEPPSFVSKVNAPAEETTSSFKKSSPVSIVTSKSELAPPCGDIEMLSAKSQDGMESQTTVEQPPPKETEVENQLKEMEIKPPAEKKGGNTISEDTKALVKQALLNATQRRQRAESHGGDELDKSKPITAAQRQKEREEKRRKKKERAKEKVKKTKDKKGANEQSMSLSSEDRELLKRWMGMQTPQEVAMQNATANHSGPSFSPPQTNNSSTGNNNSNNLVQIQQSTRQELSGLKATGRQYVIKGSIRHRHILAKTAATSSPVSLAKTASSNHQMSTGGSVLISSSQMANAVSNTFIPVIAVPSTTNPGQIDIKRIVHPSQRPSADQSVSESSNSNSSSSSTTSSSASDTTKTLLQNAILLRNSNSNNSVALSTLHYHQPVSVSKNLEAKASPGQRNGSKSNNFSSAEDVQSSGNSRLNEAVTGKSDVLFPFPLKAMQESPAIKPDPENVSVSGNVPPSGNQSPDILDFLNMKTAHDSPPSFGNIPFPAAELATSDGRNDLTSFPSTPDGRNDLTSFPSLSFSPTAAYPFHQSPERAPSSDISCNTLPKSVFTESTTTEISHPNAGLHDLPDQTTTTTLYQSNSIFQSPHHADCGDAVDEFPQMRFQGMDSGMLRSVNEMSLPSMPEPSASVGLFAASPHQVTHEDMLFTDGGPNHHHHHQHHHNSVSPFDPTLACGESSSSSSFQQNLFQQPNPHGAVVHNDDHHHHQPMQFQQSDHSFHPHLSQSPHMFAANNPPQSFSIATRTEISSSSSSSSTLSTASANRSSPFTPHPPSSGFDFHSNPSSHMSFFSHQHQHQQQQQHEQLDHRDSHVQELQNQHRQLEHHQLNTLSQQQQQQQHNLFCQEQQSYPQQQQQQQHQQQNLHFSHPSHYHHLHEQQHQHQLQQQQQQQNFLQSEMYTSPNNPHYSLLNTTPDLPVPSFSLANPNGGDDGSTFSSSTGTVASDCASTSYQATTFRKDHLLSSGKGGQLTVDTRKDRRMFLDPNKDLIALLSKQMSKSQVVDTFPPALALTPKGTGAGYGLGMDLDSILTDAQDNSMRVEQSPLSSSLLADWLDISGSISQADIEALEQELALQSPMHVSYNDGNL